MLYLVLFPVIYAALAYRPLRPRSCGLSALAQLVGDQSRRSRHRAPAANLFMIAAVIGGMSVLAVAASVYRDQLQRSEAVLLTRARRAGRHRRAHRLSQPSAFHERLAVEIERALRHHRPLSLIVVDIDDFKSVNDTYGHPSGDQALVAVAAALRSELRSGDVVGRVGGDEFAIILAETAIDGAETHARRITRTLERRPAPSVAVSIGLAGLDPSEPSAAHLLRDADRALYHVKGTGRHGIAATSSSGALIRLARG